MCRSGSQSASSSGACSSHSSWLSGSSGAFLPNESQPSSGRTRRFPTTGVTSTHVSQLSPGARRKSKTARSRGRRPRRRKRIEVPRRRPFRFCQSVTTCAPVSDECSPRWIVPSCCASRMSAKSEPKESSSRTDCGSAAWFVTTMSSCRPSATKRSRLTESVGSGSPSCAPTKRAEKWSTTRLVRASSGFPSRVRHHCERWRTSSKKKPSGRSAAMSPLRLEKTKVAPSTMIRRSSIGVRIPRWGGRYAQRMAVLDQVGQGLWNAFQMAWEVWWALVLGFLLSGIVQAWVPRTQMSRALGGRGPRSLALATGLGAASSSCSYAAVAIAKSAFQKGASLAAAMAFQFASTNLVFEIGIVMWIFLGWEFTLAEFVGGIVLIALMWAGIRLMITRRLEEQAREHAQSAQIGHEHHTAGVETLGWRERLASAAAWSDVAHNFRADWEMLWKEITAGFVIAGFIALLPMSFFNGLFITDAPAAPQLLENVVVGPLVALLSFVCSVGNVPLAAVLWAGGISFSGVIAFIYADLIIVPIVLIYVRYYGKSLTWRMVAIMFGTMVAAALAVDGIFAAAGLIPTHRPSIDSIVSRGIAWNYTTVLDIAFALVAAALFGLTVRRGARDPVCGMTVDRHRTPHRSVVDGRTVYFCGLGCKREFDAAPDAYLHSARRQEAAPAHAGHHEHH